MHNYRKCDGEYLSSVSDSLTCTPTSVFCVRHDVYLKQSLCLLNAIKLELLCMYGLFWIRQIQALPNCDARVAMLLSACASRLAHCHHIKGIMSCKGQSCFWCDVYELLCWSNIIGERYYRRYGTSCDITIWLQPMIPPCRLAVHAVDCYSRRELIPDMTFTRAWRAHHHHQ